MRIFNKEKDKEVVYVQCKDIKFIEKEGYHSPSLYGISKVVNDDTFVQFVDQEYVDFFKKQTYIPNYKTLRDLTTDNLNLIIEEKENELVTITNDFHAARPEERNTQDFFKKKATMSYEIASIKEYIETIKTKKELYIPLTIDTDEEQILSSDNNPLSIKVGYSLDKKHLLCAKTSGEAFTPEDNIPSNLFYKAMIALGINTEQITKSNELINFRGTLSQDQKFIISEKLPSKDEKMSYKIPTEKIKQFFKSLPEKITSKKTTN